MGDLSSKKDQAKKEDSEPAVVVEEEVVKKEAPKKEIEALKGAEPVKEEEKNQENLHLKKKLS